MTHIKVLTATNISTHGVTLAIFVFSNTSKIFFSLALLPAFLFSKVDSNGTRYLLQGIFNQFAVVPFRDLTHNPKLNLDVLLESYGLRCDYRLNLYRPAVCVTSRTWCLRSKMIKHSKRTLIFIFKALQPLT